MQCRVSFRERTSHKQLKSYSTIDKIWAYNGPIITRPTAGTDTILLKETKKNKSNVSRIRNRGRRIFVRGHACGMKRRRACRASPLPSLPLLSTSSVRSWTGPAVFSYLAEEGSINPHSTYDSLRATSNHSLPSHIKSLCAKGEEYRIIVGEDEDGEKGGERGVWDVGYELLQQQYNYTHYHIRFRRAHII